MHKFTFAICFGLAILIVSIGCSGGKTHVNNFVAPEILANTSTLPAGVSDWAQDGTPSQGMGVMGLFNVHVDAQNQIAQLTTLREGMLTDVLEVVDITNFLQLAPCYDCVKIESISIDADGNIVVSIGIKHPFDAGDSLKPVTGRNRADLHVFNIEGIVISNSTGATFGGVSETIAEINFINADGFSGYLDSAIDEIYPTDATIHPYMTHFDDYSAGNFDASNPMGFASVTDPPPSGNLVMAMGCDYDYQDYIFNIAGEFDFIFAVGCTYAVSAATKHDRFTPEYRIPQHNKKSASEVSVEIITNELAAGNETSTAEIEIHVVDISHNVPVGEALNEMFADSSVSQITIDVPSVTLSPVIVTGGSSISGTGHDPTDPLVYPATITNTASGDVGIYPALVKVTDLYAPGMNTNPLLYGMDGITRVDPIANPLEGLFAIDEFATYQTFDIEVFSGNDAPVCDLNVSDTEVGQGAIITADPGTSNDPDGSIISYEYDNDYDVVTFNAVVTQNSVDPDFGVPVNLSMPCNTTGNPLIITVAIRVCDDGDPSRCTICTEDVTVTEKLGSVGDVTVTAINRGEGGANPQLLTSVDLDWEDNPCDVVEYAIERGDGWTGTGWTVIDTTTTSDYKFQPSGDTDWDDDMRFRVIARAVVGGDPASDSDPSYEVFILFVCNGGYQVPGNKWVTVTETGYQWFWTLTYWSGGGPNVDGWSGTSTTHRGIGPVCHDDYAVTNRWSFARPPQPFPDLEGQKEVFCDGYYQLFQGWPVGSMALCFGTVSDPNPPITQTECYDFEPTNDIYGSGIPYNSSNVEGLNHEFDETNQGGFVQLTPAPLYWGHVGFYLNDLLEEDRDYVAIGLAIGSTPVPPNQCVVGWNDGFIYVVH